MALEVNMEKNGAQNPLFRAGDSILPWRKSLLGSVLLPLLKLRRPEKTDPDDLTITKTSIAVTLGIVRSVSRPIPSPERAMGEVKEWFDRHS